jgi:hypothetical protein
MVNEQQETTRENKTDGYKSPSSELVERAREERERLQQENARIEKNLTELRELEASRLLGGTAGGRVEPVVKIETAKEYADKVMSGAIK